MNHYTGEIKSKHISIRVTDTLYNYIDKFDGKYFNQKLDNLIKFSMEIEETKKKELSAVRKEIKKLTVEREKLLSDIKQLQNAGIVISNILNNLEQLDHQFAAQTK